MADHLFGRIDDLERRIRRLDAELSEVRRLAEAARLKPTTAGPTAVSPPLQPRVPRQPRVSPAPRRETPLPPHDVGKSVRDLLGRVDRKVTLADLFGPKALAWAGGIVTVLGVVFFFVLAVNRGWIGPELRVAFGAAASAAALGAGLWLRRRFGETYSALGAAGAGIAGAYASLLAAVALYHLVPKPVALVLAGAIATAGVAVSLLWRAQLVAAIGLVGAMVVPALLAVQGGLSVVGTAFVAIVLAGTSVVAVRMRWRGLLAAGVVASLLQIAALVADVRNPSATVVSLAGVFWLLYVAAGVAEQLTRNPDDVEPLPASLIFGSAGFFVYSSALLFGDRGGSADQGIAYLVAAAAYAAGAIFVRRQVGVLLGALALAAVAVGAADLLSGASLTYAWAAEGAVLAWSAQRFARVRLQLAALVYLALAAGHALALEATPSHLFHPLAHPAGGAPAVAACAVAMLAAALTSRGVGAARDDALHGLLRPLASALRALRTHEGIVRGVACTVGGLLGVYAASLGVLAAFQAWTPNVERGFELAHLALTAGWAVLGLVAFVLAVLRRNESAFAVAVGWLGVVVLKTAVFDASQLEHTLWPYAFFAVAAVAFAATILLHELNDAIERIHPLAFAGLAITLALAVVGGIQVGGDRHGDAIAVLATGVAVALLGGFELRLPRLRAFATLLWGSGLLVAAVGEAMLVGGVPLVLIWTATAVLLAALAAVVRERRLHVAAVGYLALAAAYAVGRECPPDRFFQASEHPAAHFAALLLVVVASAAVSLLVRGETQVERRAHVGLSWTAGIAAVYGLCLAILELAERVAPGNDVHTNFQRGHTAVSGFLGLLGVGLLYAGLTRRRRALRIGGLALLGAIVAKIFLYDLAALSSAARAVSFLAVGGVLLLGGFFYQRLTSNGA